MTEDQDVDDDEAEDEEKMTAMQRRQRLRNRQDTGNPRRGRKARRQGNIKNQETRAKALNRISSVCANACVSVGVCVCACVCECACGCVKQPREKTKHLDMKDPIGT